MPTPPRNAQLGLSQFNVETLAPLYDRFAHALDPFDPTADEAEAVFKQEVVRLYDLLSRDEVSSVSLKDFQRAVVQRCKAYLIATDKKSSI